MSTERDEGMIAGLLGAKVAINELGRGTIVGLEAAYASISAQVHDPAEKLRFDESASTLLEAVRRTTGSYDKLIDILINEFQKINNNVDP